MIRKILQFIFLPINLFLRWRNERGFGFEEVRVLLDKPFKARNGFFPTAEIIALVRKWILEDAASMGWLPKHYKIHRVSETKTRVEIRDDKMLPFLSFFNRKFTAHAEILKGSGSFQSIGEAMKNLFLQEYEKECPEEIISLGKKWFLEKFMDYSGWKWGEHYITTFDDGVLDIHLSKTIVSQFQKLTKTMIDREIKKGAGGKKN